MKLILGDCLDKLKELEDNSIDSIVTDPPYGLSFMGKEWDYDVPSQEIWEECMRVLKPGGHLLSFAGSRTYHRMAVRIEDAGFEIRDQIMWIYGSGFPKSMDISKQIDKREGAEREVIGKTNGSGMTKSNVTQGAQNRNVTEWDIVSNEPVSDLAKQWNGWGTALKPAHEPIVMARKPLSEKTVVDNVLEWGTGGINIDDSRIDGGERDARENNTSWGISRIGEETDIKGNKAVGKTTLGRFPANVIFDEEAGKILDEQSGVSKSSGGRAYQNTNDMYSGGWSSKDEGLKQDPGFGDVGGASRFFYCPKTSKRDRNEGCDVLEEKQNIFNGKSNNPSVDMKGVEKKFTTQPKSNHHPTVKPTDLMLYLIRMVTPKGGTTLDPFMGSGSTGKAAVRGGFDFVGVEREEEYMEIAETRIQYEIDNPYNEETGKRVTVNKQSQKFW